MQLPEVLNLLLATFTTATPQNSTLDYNEWWGPEGLQGQVDTSIRPASIKFDQVMIDRLRSRLQNHETLKPPLKDAAFTYGFNSVALEQWAQKWANNYDFKARETFLNQFPQYKVNVQGLDIHFIWVKPQVASTKPVVPLLLLHGWPGSIREFYEAIPLLTRDDPSRDFAVEVIVPCLPGFGFTDAAVRPGLGAAQAAILFKNFMNKLGFEQFYLQGGDWGSSIGNDMVTLYTDEVLGYHTNWGRVIGAEALGIQVANAHTPSLIVDPKLADRMYPLSSIAANLLEELGYMHEAATKPDTVGAALTDSPIGLMAYLMEKFSGATNPANKYLPDGGLNNTFTPDQLLDNLMFYWAPGCITTSLRLYAETFNKKQFALGLEGKTTTVPTWVIQAKYEATYQPPSILKLKFTNLLNATVLDFGGHFLALEAPQVFSDDVLNALSAFRSLYASKNSSNADSSNVFKRIAGKILG